MTIPAHDEAMSETAPSSPSLSNPAAMDFIARAARRGETPTVAQTSRHGRTWVVTPTLLAVFDRHGSHDVYPLAHLTEISLHANKRGVTTLYVSGPDVARRFLSPEDRPELGRHLALVIEDQIARAALRNRTDT